MANVLFMDGFDAYDFGNSNTSLPSITSKWVGNNNGIFGYAGRYGGQAMGVGNSYYSPYMRGYFNNNLYVQQATYGFAMMPSSVIQIQSMNRFFKIKRGQDNQFTISASNIGEIQMWRGDTLVAQSPPTVIKTYDWHYFELEYISHASAGRASLYLDGVLLMEFTGNTQAVGAYGFNGVEFSGGQDCFIAFDDLYIIDTATRIGERRIETLRPNGDIAGNNFTPSSGTDNFAMLNETLVSANQYVTANLVGNQDLYNFSNLSTIPNKIDAVQLSVYATKTDAETRQMATIVKSGSAQTTSANYNLPTNHTNLNRIENLDPATGAPWTPTAVNAIQAGFKVTL